MSERSSVAVPRRKSFWKMVRSMLLPNRVFSSFASCGGVKLKRRRTVEKMKSRDRLPRSRPPSQRQVDHHQTQPLPQTVSNDSNLSSVLETSLQNLEISTNPDSCSPENVTNNESSTNSNIIINTTVVHNHNTRRVSSTNSQDARNNESNIILCSRTGSISSEVYRPSVITSASVSTLPVIPRIPPNNNVDEILIDVDSTNSPTDSTSLNDEVVVRRRKKADEVNNVDGSKFHGWRKSSIEVAPQPPQTLKWIPSGLQVGDKVMWITDSQPERAIVRWIGKIRDHFHAGIEFERKIGNSSGLYGYGMTTYQRLFTCELGYGRFVPVTELVLYSDFHDKGLKAGFICVICRDDFLELPDYHAAGDGQMVATKCGHLYHQYCLTEWFSKSKQLSHQCPHCQHVIDMDDIIRVFPAQV